MARYTGIDYPFASSTSCCCRPFLSRRWSTPAASPTCPGSCCSTRRRRRTIACARAHVIAHETAHSWFGNLVTMRWFDDVWTKEVFANFMASKIADPLFPGRAARSPVLPPASPRRLRRRPFRGHPPDPAAAGQPRRRGQPVHGDHLPEGAGGDAPARVADRRGRDSAPGCARTCSATRSPTPTWDDLVDALAPHAGFDLSRLEPGLDRRAGPADDRNRLRAARRPRVERLRLRQSDPQRRGRLWPQQLRVTLVCAGGLRRLTADLVGPEIDLTGALGDALRRPCSRAARAGATASSSSTSARPAFLVDGLMRLDDPLARAVAWSALGRDARGRMTPDRLLLDRVAALGQRNRRAADERSAARHADAVVALHAAGRARGVCRSAGGAAAAQARRGADGGAKADWFRALRALAITPADAWLAACSLATRIARAGPAARGVGRDRAGDGARGARRGRCGRARGGAGRSVSPIPDRRARLGVRARCALERCGRARALVPQLADPAKRRPETWVVEGMG